MFRMNMSRMNDTRVNVAILLHGLGEQEGDMGLVEMDESHARQLGSWDRLSAF